MKSPNGMATIGNCTLALNGEASVVHAPRPLLVRDNGGSRPPRRSKSQVAVPPPGGRDPVAQSQPHDETGDERTAILSYVGEPNVAAQRAIETGARIISRTTCIAPTCDYRESVLLCASRNALLAIGHEFCRTAGKDKFSLVVLPANGLWTITVLSNEPGVEGKTLAAIRRAGARLWWRFLLSAQRPDTISPVSLISFIATVPLALPIGAFESLLEATLSGTARFEVLPGACPAAFDNRRDGEAAPTGAE